MDFCIIEEWYNKIRFLFNEILFEIEKIKIMINRDRWRYLYLKARGEILGFFKDKQKRKHLSSIYSLIKN